MTTDELAARRMARGEQVPQPDEETPLITMFADSPQIVFRDQQALDEYVREAKGCDH